jgi:hypothetical protein
MSHFTDIARRRHTAEADTKSEDKPSSEEHSSVHRRTLNAGPDDDDQGAHEHAASAAPVVVDRPCEEDGWDRTNIVEGKDNPGAGARCFPGLR